MFLCFSSSFLCQIFISNIWLLSFYFFYFMFYIFLPPCPILSLNFPGGFFVQLCFICVSLCPVMLYIYFCLVPFCLFICNFPVTCCICYHFFLFCFFLSRYVLYVMYFFLPALESFLCQINVDTVWVKK